MRYIRSHRTIVATATAVCWAFLATTAVSAATLRVPSEYGTIQAAIDSATQGDIVLVADGEYSGSGNIRINFHGKVITVRSENGPERTVLNGAGDGPGVFFLSAETPDAVLMGFTITGCHFYGAGAGIVVRNGASPTIVNCVIAGNFAFDLMTHGGGVAVENGSPTFVNCTIASNVVDSDTPHRVTGLFVSINSTVTLVRTIVAGNCGTHDIGFYGGTIIAECSAIGRLWEGSEGQIKYIGEPVFEDPMFCGSPPPCRTDAVDPMEYRIHAESPCFPTHSPCGELIGALGVGCPAASIAEGGSGLRPGLRWSGPDPNPVREQLRFGLEVSGASEFVRATIVSASGALVETLVERELGVGPHSFAWQPVSPGGRELPSGVYYLRLETRDGHEARRFVVIR